MTLETGAYWEAKGVETFYPQVEIRFAVDPEEGGVGGKGHWHVPVLLGPHGYTTYRGS